MPGRTRANGEGSIFPYRNGYAAYVWVTKPDGKRTRKYVYGKTRELVHDKWIKLHQQAKQGPVATKVPTVKRLGGWGTPSAVDRCCTFLLYGQKKGHSCRWEVAFELRGRYWDRTSDLFGVNKVNVCPWCRRLAIRAGRALGTCWSDEV